MFYGENFDKFTSFMWNLTNQRFIPNSVAGLYYEILDEYDQETTEKEKSRIPGKWVGMREGASFINNTRDCWVTYVPWNVAVFLVLHVIYRVLVRVRSKHRTRIIAFKWISILITSTIIQNIQFISFRSFQQLRYGVSPSAQPSIFLYFLNQFISYFCLFFVIIYACCGYSILNFLIGKNVKYALDLVKYSSKAALYLGLTQVIKVTNGFAHAWLFSNRLAQMGLIFLGQATVLFSIIYFRSIFALKSVFSLLIIEYLLRVIVHIYLTLRINWKTT